MTLIRNTKELKLNKLFAGVDESVVNSVFKPEYFKNVKEGEVIYQTGDDADHLYLLLRGDVKIKFPSHNYISNKIFNDFFGEKEIFDKTSRNSSAVANSKCLLFLISKNIYETLLTESPAVKKNIDTYGEIELPEAELVANGNLNLSHKDKPISFRATSSKKKKEKSSIPENGNITEIRDPISETISEIIEKENPIAGSSLFKDGMGIAEEEKSESLNIEPGDNIEIIEEDQIPTNLQSTEVESLEGQIDIQNIIEVLNTINSQLRFYDTIQSIKRGLKKLTSSEAAEIYLIDEAAGNMIKFVREQKALKRVRKKISDGLTGTCALQKKTLNFDQPTKDSRFIQSIDQPGNTALKKIIYIPLIDEKDNLVAVLQLAREYEPYYETEIKQSELITTQAAIALKRSKKYEKLIDEEKQKFNNNIEMFLTDNLLIPIDIINRYTYFLNNEEFSKEIKEIISLLQQQANLFWDIIQSTFDYKKNDFELNLDKYSINSYMNGISEILSEYCESRNINLFKKTGEDTKVQIDPGKLFMAIYQIIRNACDVSVADANVYISTEKKDSNVQINIMDEGPGIAEELKDKIYASIYSKDKGRNRLGMNIAKKIIDLHSGQLNFLTTKNKGTTFSISIPVYNEAE